jgi:hypothetical protein
MRSVLTLGMVLSLTAQDPPAPSPVPDLPAAALPAAQRGPLAVALVLAASGVPAGIITSEDPDRDPGIPQAPPDSPAISGAAVAQRLLTHYPRYAMEWRRGVIGIEPRQSVCGEELTATTLGPATVEGRVAQVLVLLGWIASGDPSPAHRGVVSQIAIGRAEPGPPAPPRALRLVLSKTVTLREALDELVRQNAAGVWTVWQHPRPDGAVGCRLIGYFPDGVVVASNTDFAVVP